MRFAFFLILLLLSPVAVLGNDNANANGQAGQQGEARERGNGGNGNGGNGGAQGNAGNPGGNGAAPGNGNAGVPREAPQPGPAPSGDNSQPSVGNPVKNYPQSYARAAVNAGQAVSLSSLLPDIRQRTAGEVIDAEMLGVQDMLVYAVRVLRADGRVTREFYDARSGRHIGSE